MPEIGDDVTTNYEYCLIINVLFKIYIHLADISKTKLRSPSITRTEKKSDLESLTYGGREEKNWLVSWVSLCISVPNLRFKTQFVWKTSDIIFDTFISETTRIDLILCVCMCVGNHIDIYRVLSDLDLSRPAMFTKFIIKLAILAWEIFCSFVFFFLLQNWKPKYQRCQVQSKHTTKRQHLHYKYV